MLSESHASFGGEQLLPDAEAAVPLAAPAEIERRPKMTMPETVWTRVDPDHVQLPVPQRRNAAEKQPVVAAEPEQEAAGPPRNARPEALGDILKTQALPNLDIRPQHFYTDSETRPAHQPEQQHDILPSVAPKTVPAKTETFQQFEQERRAVPASPEAAPEIAQLSHHELLLFAGTINIGGANLLEIYNAKRIDEDGLRHIVAESLQGHPVEEVLRQEELREQMKFEMDPSLRHSPEATASLLSRMGSGASKQAKKVVNPQRVKQHADNAAAFVVGGLERMIEERDTPPSPAKIAAWTVGTIVYFIVLIWALKR